MGRAAVGCLVVPFVLGALVTTLVGFAFLADGYSRSSAGVEVEGVIVELIESRDPDGDTLYRPVVAYAVDGVTYEVESRTSSGGALRPRLGDARTVLYYPQNPGDAVLGGFWALWGGPLLMVLIPLLLLGGALWAVLRARRRADSGPSVVDTADGLRYSRQRRNDGVDEVASPGPGGVDVDSAARIQALFMGVEPSPMDVSGRTRFRVRARGEVNGEPRRFFSAWLDEDPTVLLMSAGNRVEVVFDPSDPDRYRVVVPADDD